METSIDSFPLLNACGCVALTLCLFFIGCAGDGLDRAEPQSIGTVGLDSMFISSSVFPLSPERRTTFPKNLPCWGWESDRFFLHVCVCVSFTVSSGILLATSRCTG